MVRQGQGEAEFPQKQLETAFLHSLRLIDQNREYLQMLYGLKKKDRIFTVTKSYLHHEMDRGAKAAGVKRNPYS